MMQTHMSRYVLLVALVAMLWATEAMAATIGFDGLTKSNLSSFTSYTHTNDTSETTDDFTVAPTPGGQWFEAHIFGNRVPAIGAGDVYTPDGGRSEITVTMEASGLFTFMGVDLTSNVAGGTSYTIEGFLDKSGGITESVFTTTFKINSINHFESKLFSNLGPVNRLTIAGTRGVGVTSFNIDNIRVLAASGPSPPGGGCTGNCPDPNVPEPASLLLLGAGLAGIEVWRRKRGSG
jgi:PEP-CTERM motif